MKVRRTSPMSPRVTIRSPLVFTARDRMSLGFCTTPGTLTENMPWPDCRSPAGTSRLLRAMRPESSLGVTPCACMRTGSMVTSIISSRPPASSAPSTPGSPSSLRCSDWAFWNRVRSGAAPYMMTVITGLSVAAVISWMIGGRASGGNLPRAMSTLERTSFRARSRLAVGSNCSRTMAAFSTAWAFISLRPSVDWSSVSSGRTISRSESSGLTPG